MTPQTKFAARVELDADDPALDYCRHQDDSPWILTREAESLCVLDARQPAQRPLRLDFSGPELRDRVAAGRRGHLARAVGYKKPPWQVLDMTAGLGRDAATCAGLGMQVRAYERHPLLFALLEDAWRRAEPRLQARLELHYGEADSSDWATSDAVIYDPMYPLLKSKRAAPSLELQRLREIIGPDQDTSTVFAKLREHPPRRLALKRPPHGARVRLEQPDCVFGGGRVSWEVYIARSCSR